MNATVAKQQEADARPIPEEQRAVIIETAASEKRSMDAGNARIFLAAIKCLLAQQAERSRVFVDVSKRTE